jgi:hypothetical protein
MHATGERRPGGLRPPGVIIQQGGIMQRAMRATIVALMVTAAGARAAMAQAQWQPSFGIFGAWNYTTAQGSDVQDAKYRSGFMAGVLMDAWPKSRWSLQPEVQYTQKGAKYEGADTSGTTITPFTEEIKLSYVEIPVLLRLNGDEMNGMFTPHVLAGPFVAFKSGCSVSASATGVTMSTNCSGLDLNSVDYGATVGVGGDFRVAGSQKFIAGIRYEWGFRDIPKDASVKNRGFNFLVGWRW